MRTPVSTRPEQDSLIRHGVMLMMITQVINAANILFQAVMGWTLPAEEYGILAAMLGAVVIVATPMDAMRTAFAHYAARFAEEGRMGQIHVLVSRWVRGVTCLAVPVAVAGILLSGLGARFLHMDRQMPLVLTSIMIAGCAYSPMFAGVLQGAQSFLWMSLVQHLWGIVRFLLATVLVLTISRTAEWGLLAQLLGLLAAIVVGRYGIRRVIPVAAGNDSHDISGAKTYFLHSLLALAGFAALMNMDVILVKRFFSPEQAGYFARAGTIGRAVVFLPMPIALAMFPKVVSSGTVSRQNWNMLVKAMVFAAIMIAMAVGAGSLLPGLALRLMYNETAPTPEMIWMVRVMMWAMSPLGLAYILLNFELAQHRFKPAVSLLCCAVLYVVLAGKWHDSVFQIAAVLAGVSVLALALLVLGLPWAGGSEKARDSRKDSSSDWKGSQLPG